MRKKSAINQTEHTYSKLPLEQESSSFKPEAAPNQLLSLVALKITPTETPHAIAHVIVSKNNKKKEKENWKCQMVFHRCIKEYLDRNEMEKFEIKFVFADSTYDSLVTRFGKATPISDSDFMNYEFIYNHPVKSGITQYTFKTFSVRVGFKSSAEVDHHLFNMVIFQ